MNFKNRIRKFILNMVVAVLMAGIFPASAAAASDITVTVGVYDYTAVTYGSGHASATGVVLEETAVTVAENATAQEAILTALNEKNIPSEVNSQNNYITSVNGLAADDCGVKSGWMFCINDDFVNADASATAISSGDHLKLHYSVAENGTDVGNYSSGAPTITKLTIGGVETVISDGAGTMSSPCLISINVSAGMDITNLTAQVESTLHPSYISYGTGAGLTDISKPANYENDVTVCLQTIGGYKQTVYTIRVTKSALPLPDYTGDWTCFRGNAQNMGITYAKTPKTADGAVLKWAVNYSSGWSQTITPPILLNDCLYIAKGKKIAKIDPDNGEILAESTDMVGSVGYALNPVTYGGGMIFVPVGNGQVQALRADTLESVWVSEPLGGQTLTPVTYQNGYIYTGTWNSEIKTGTYFCLSAADEDAALTDETKTCTWKLNQKGGFYWAGAYATDRYVIFGSDDGDAGNTAESAVLFSVSPVTGTVIDTIEGVRGDIRSTVSYDSVTDRIYFTTKGGELYQVKVKADGSFDDSKTKIFDLGGMCTGTPLVDNGLAYLGVSGSSQFSPTGHSYKIIDVTTSPMKEVGAAEIPGYVQTSALLSTAYAADTNKVYVYATYNYPPGGIYVIEAEKTGQKDADGAAIVNTAGSHLFTPEGAKAQYCLCSLVCDKNGVIYYKNDSGYLMAIAPKPLSEKAITGFSVARSTGVINETTKTIAVTVAYGEDVTRLTPTVTISDSASVNPTSGAIVDFTNPVTYTVTAEDGSTQDYVVTVTQRSILGGGGSADDLTTDKTLAKASLQEALNKYVQSDYTAENWKLLQSAYDTGVANIDAAVTCNAVYAALNNATFAMGNINTTSTATITVCVSMEKFTLGQGYIIEPTLVQVPKYTPASTVITDLLKKKYTSIAQPFRNTGTVTEGFYLSYVYDTETNVNIPAYILTAMGGNADTRGSDSLLGEFDYSQWSGWMYSVNGQFPGVGASSWRLTDHEVMRWQFTLFGYGADLNADNSAWGQTSLKSLADKDALTWKMAQINALSNKTEVLAVGDNQSKYNAALAALIKIDSTQTEVDSALTGLGSLATVSGSSGGGGGGSTTVADTTIPVAAVEKKTGFADVGDTHWAKQYVDYLSDKGIVGGKEAGRFAPDDNITRAEFVTILSRISSQEKAVYTGEFDDVNKDDWCAGAIAWAVQAGIAKGTAQNAFAPQDNITREQMAAMLARFAQYMKFKLPSKIETMQFDDGDSISDFAKEAVATMQKAGVIGGKENRLFAPADSATRAEAAKMLTILMQEMENQ